MIGRKEVPLDGLVLVCLHLSIYYFNEIKIAFANAGNLLTLTRISYISYTRWVTVCNGR